VLHIILYQPEIPPNTGNIMRLCANTGARLHLVEPLGFHLDDATLRRAGLNYIDQRHVHRHTDWNAFRSTYPDLRLWAYTTRAQAAHSAVTFAAQDGLLFGPESRGLPTEILEQLGPAQCLRIPMRADSRSMNLSNAVAVGLYEAWRQLGYSSLA
jgi:tRNA (cytidine/uridine-2'-O-)-methyltransferase